MLNENALKMVKQALHLENTSIQHIKRIGGLTNVNYIVTINGENFIVRIPGEGTDELVNRDFEKDNLLFATSIGVNPEHIYYNEQTSMKITREIPNPTTLTMPEARRPETMNKMIALLHKLHNAHHVMNNRFELFTLMTHYEELVKGVNPTVFEGFLPLKQKVEELKNVYEAFHVKEVPCHIDTICDNFVSSGSGDMYLIDWEYSGMFDPMWDIATLMLGNEYSAADEKLFLRKYFEREPSAEEIKRIHLHKIFQDYLWSLWGVYKTALGDSPEQYFTNLFVRAEGNLAIYEEIYTDQAVEENLF